MARVLVLDNTLHPRLFALGRRWAGGLGEASVDIVRVPLAGSLPNVRGYTHLVLTGSEASIPRWTAWMQREAECVREAAAVSYTHLTLPTIYSV